MNPRHHIRLVYYHPLMFLFSCASDRLSRRQQKGRSRDQSAGGHTPHSFRPGRQHDPAWMGLGAQNLGGRSFSVFSCLLRLSSCPLSLSVFFGLWSHLPATPTPAQTAGMAYIHKAVAGRGTRSRSALAPGDRVSGLHYDLDRSLNCPGGAGPTLFPFLP